MPPSEPKEISGLLKKHASTIALLKSKVESNFPDLASNSSLNDGTVVDELFYLRYVLSSKEDLSSEDKIGDSKTFRSISFAISERNSSFGFVNEQAKAKVFNLLPIKRTGKLSNGFPVVFLSVKEALENVNKISNDKECQKLVQLVMIADRNELFNELDAESRLSGKLLKSVSIYDCSGLSFSHIYKLKEFLKVLDAQKKVFKQLFPQCTELTVFADFPQPYLLKKCLSSSKQVCMKSDKLIQSLNCAHTLPPSMGGSFQLSNMNVETQVQTTTDLVQSSQILPLVCTSQQRTKAQQSLVEREMVKMSKGKVFSINVLKPNQKVNLLFNNMKAKQSHVLVLTMEDKEKLRKLPLAPGFSTVSLKLRKAGELLIVHVDTAMANNMYTKHNKKQIDFSNADFKRGSTRRAIRYGRNKLKKKKGGLSQLDYLRLQQMNGGLKQKVYFRFELTDSVVVGQERPLTAADIKQYESTAAVEITPKVATQDKDFVDFEASSLSSKDSYGVGDDAPSFLSSAIEILGKGIFW